MDIGSSTALVHLNQIERALSEARSISEIIPIINGAEALRQCCRLAHSGLEMQNEAAELKLRAERRAGQKLAEMEKNNGQLYRGSIMEPREEIPTLSDLGITKKQSHRWQLEHCLSKDRFEQYIATTKAAGKELTSAGLIRLAKNRHVQQVMGSSESPEWYTPQHIVELTLKLFNGVIDTDPCSNSKTSPNVPATFLYTKEDDGLKQTWHGASYMNPPYGKEIPRWVDTLIEKYEQGEIEQAITLLPGRIDTRWFQPLYAYPMCMIRGRLNYPSSPSATPFPSVVVYMGDNRKGFIEVFSELGPIMERIG